MSARRAVVLFSGGMDSAVVLALARERGFACHTLAVDYGQRHRAELAAAAHASRVQGAEDHRVVRVDLRAIGGSALTDDIAVPDAGGGGVPVTYVPARNTLMLTLALGLAEVIGARDLFCGINAVDFSGYPDCRPEFLLAFQKLANVATVAGGEGAGFTVHAPLLDMSKARIAQEAARLGVDLAGTVTCYRADDAGRACGDCDACVLRAKGFAEAGLPDPTRYR